LTAIIPIPIIYYTLDVADIRLPLPEAALQDGEQFARRLVARYGWGTPPPESRITTTTDDTSTDNSIIGATSHVFVNLAIAYAIVKVLMPVRIAACFALTPWFARVAVAPTLNGVQNISRRLARPLGNNPK
jgi:hypothetical protein